METQAIQALFFEQVKALTRSSVPKKDYFEDEELDEVDLDVYSDEFDEDFDASLMEKGFMQGYNSAFR